jgi:MFS family permease
MKNYRPIIAICAISAVFAASLAMTPGITNFMEYYGVSETTASLILTIPPLVSIPFTLLTGKLVEYISKKLLLLIGIAVVTIAGIVPYFLNNFNAIIGTRVVMGAALGILYSITPTLAAICYPEGRMRTLGMGMQSAWSCAGGFIFNIISGYLVGIRTNMIFLTYCLCILFFIIAAVSLPNLRTSDSVRTDTFEPESPSEKGSAFDKRCISFVITTFIFIICDIAIILNVSLFITDSGLGNSVQAGYVSSAFSVAAFASGCLYNWIDRLFKSRLRSCACLFSAAGLLLCGVTHTLILAYIGSALTGLAVTMLMTSAVAQVTTTVRPAAFTMSISLLLSVNYLAHSTSVYIITPLAALFGDAVQNRFYLAGVIVFLLGIYIFFDENRRKAKAGVYSF